MQTVLEQLAEKQNGIRAVIVTGGEPTLHGNRLMHFLEECQSMGLLTRIETNGSNPFMIRTLVEHDLVDSIVLDLKAPLYPERYLNVTGKIAVLNKIKRSVFMTLKSGVDYEFRVVVVPGRTLLRDIQSIARSVRGAKRLVLQEFTPFSGCLDKSFESVSPTAYDELIEMAQRITGIQEVRIRTNKGEETVGHLSPIQNAIPRKEL
jgi:pyruvate formate lyase activating enzyme